MRDGSLEQQAQEVFEATGLNPIQLLDLSRELLTSLQGCMQHMEWNTDSAKHACNQAGEVIAEAEPSLNPKSL